MKENDISYDVRGAAFKVHSELGPGLLESVYEAALAYELELMGHTVQRQLGVPMVYKVLKFDIGFRLDILVDDCVIVELKSVDSIHPVHQKQLLTYLTLSNKKLGLLINFNVTTLSTGITRIVNKL